MSIFKLDSKIYGAWSVEKEDNVYLDYHWNDSHDSLCESKTQIALKFDEDSNKGKASQVLKKNVSNKPDMPD
ncbi:MAG TPA: hypothetical protein VGD14_03625 [bacterium]